MVSENMPAGAGIDLELAGKPVDAGCLAKKLNHHVSLR